MIAYMTAPRHSSTDTGAGSVVPCGLAASPGFVVVLMALSNSVTMSKDDLGS